MLCSDETQDPGLAKTRSREQSRKFSSGCDDIHISHSFPPFGRTGTTIVYKKCHFQRQRIIKTVLAAATTKRQLV